MNRLPGFLQQLRKEQPATPILLVDNRPLGGSAFVPELRNNQQLENQTPAYHNRHDCRQAGMKNLYLAQHPNWFGEDGEGTDDAVHPNTVGAHRFAAAIKPFIETILKEHP